MPVPPISRATAIALCNDEYTGMPALDDDLWQGASEDARCCYFEGWAICHSEMTGRISAVNDDYEAAISLGGSIDWEAC